MSKSSGLPGGGGQLKLNNKRMSELIADQIFDWIMEGTLEAGQKISEDELAETFGVSRMPVREAIRALGAKGLVQSVPYVGSYVRKLDDDEIQEVYYLRSVLEPLAGRLSAQNITRTELDELKHLQERLESHASKPIGLEKSKQMYQLNREFHMGMYAPCHMNRLLEMIDNLWDSIAYLRMRTAMKPMYPEQMKQEHQHYLALLAKRDGEGLAAQLSENLNRHITDLPEIKKDSFSGPR